MRRVLRRLLLVAAAFCLLGLLGATGCKNVCEKMADKTRDCFDQVCGGDDAPAECEFIGRMLEESADAEYECEGEIKEDAEQNIDKSCEEIFGFSGDSE